jgi:hypothetical protein
MVILLLISSLSTWITQRRLGLLPQWWAGRGPDHSIRVAAGRALKSSRRSLVWGGQD